MSRGTTAERLARLETILARVETKIDAMEVEQRADIAALAALTNKGSGILIGVAIAAGALGASASTFLKWIAGLFH